MKLGSGDDPSFSSFDQVRWQSVGCIVVKNLPHFSYCRGRVTTRGQHRDTDRYACLPIRLFEIEIGLQGLSLRHHFVQFSTLIREHIGKDPGPREIWAVSARHAIGDEGQRIGEIAF